MSLLYGELQCPIVEIVLNPYRNQSFRFVYFFHSSLFVSFVVFFVLIHCFKTNGVLHL
jgi:hypothetical protein